ncbi:MAG: hypothetical protein N3E37_02905 [Candidatus Micrarchaeota archaeon]|nr:hypothetical protein [Candidatus Micrarchaeota archaeon]
MIPDKDKDMKWKDLKAKKLEKLKEHIVQNKVDEPILEILNMLNNSKYYVTSSSCSGRVMLLEITDSKKDATIYWKSHTVWPQGSIKNKIEEFISLNLENRNLFLHVQGFILHLYAYDIYYANKMLEFLLLSGIKRFGIMKTKNFPLIEFQSTQYLSVPVYFNQKLIINIDAVNELEQLCLTKLTKNLQKLKSLEKSLNLFLSTL